MPGYDYSAAFSDADNAMIWNYLTLYGYLQQPQAYFPGTRMDIPPLPVMALTDIVNYLTDGEYDSAYGSGAQRTLKRAALMQDFTE